jgi:predicted permease
MPEADSGYPLLNLIWTMCVIFGWIVFIALLITVFLDLFRRHDLSGWAKTAWVIFAVLLPFIGVFAYLIAEGHRMQERELRRKWAS